MASTHAASAGTSPAAGVIHIRHHHDEKFTIVGNHLAQNPNLSACAIGIGVYIQSLPDRVCVGIKTLAARFREGETRIAGALRELEQAGYLVRRRERTATGRMVTRTLWYEFPGRVDLLKRPRTTPTYAKTRLPAKPKPSAVAAEPLSPELLPAADLLATLRSLEPRLLLSEADVTRLAPQVRDWLDRGVTPDAVARTLTTDLPPGTIRWPSRLLAYRLREWLPPVLPAQPEKTAQQPRTPAPLQNCDGCDRAFRATEPGMCRSCASARHTP
ncbi:helix-turn-helix domain-containing protein [Streptomyces sp. NPDC002577]